LGDVSATTFGLPSINTWYFLCAQHDPVANTVGISVNDGVVDTSAFSGGIVESSQAFSIGARSIGANPWNGRIDDVLLFRHLTG